MIKLDNKTQQDFLNITWCRKLLNVGVDMDLDAKYYIISREHRINKDSILGTTYYVCTTEEMKQHPHSDIMPIPTYTLAELLYKLNEWAVWKGEKGDELHGPLEFLKDAPFYMFFYQRISGGEYKGEYFVGESEYPIYAAAQCLLECIKNNIGYVKNISNK